MSFINKPCNPRKTPLWQILDSHFDTFLSIYEDRFEERYGYLRPVVAKTVSRYLRCGILDYGFARVRCGEEYLLAFSCKCRSFCPSCQKKRQVEIGHWGAFIGVCENPASYYPPQNIVAMYEAVEKYGKY